MQELVTALHDYVLFKKSLLGYASINNNVLVSITKTNDETLHKKLLSNLPISLSILEEISIRNNVSNVHYTNDDNNPMIYVKGMIIGQSNNDINSNTIELEIDQYNINASLSTLYSIPSILTTLPIVGNYYLISNRQNNNGTFINCL